MPWLFIIPLALGALLLARRSAAQSAPGRLCTPPTPTAQPQPPLGWVPYRGAVSQTAIAQARAGLRNPLGTWATFTDDNGQELGVLQQWHCHEPEEGVRPVGWHKGSTLFRRA
jgi:hypothetical protein